MATQFYLYRIPKEIGDTPPHDEFSFTVGMRCKLQIPSFLICLSPRADGRALLCKIRRTKKPADFGMAIYVYEVVTVHLIDHALMKTIDPDSIKDGRELASEIQSSQHPVGVTDKLSEVIKNIIIQSNRGTIDRSYFGFDKRPLESELIVEATDALNTGLQIFGFPRRNVSNLQEQQILDFDIAKMLPDSMRGEVTADGKHIFEYGGRRLCLHKVDRTWIERCLGVDLIYNYLDEKRLVFVQYKCQKVDGKYYPRSDASYDSEIKRMEAMPGMETCPNLSDADENCIRLCRCPVFIKLCKRQIAETQSVPVGVYYPLCVWKWHMKREKGMSVRNEPHLNRLQFQELVKTGLIGSTAQQTLEIDRHLVQQANDKRLKVIFEEQKVR